MVHFFRYAGCPRIPFTGASVWDAEFLYIPLGTPNTAAPL